MNSSKGKVYTMLHTGARNTISKSSMTTYRNSARFDIPGKRAFASSTVLEANEQLVTFIGLGSTAMGTALQNDCNIE